MNRQRLLRFPPNPQFSHLPNPFAELAAYRYSQRTFKSFSDEEIKGQAGIESLPQSGKAIDSTVSQLDGGMVRG